MSDAGLTSIAFVVAAVATIAVSPLVIGLLRRLSVIDVADHRSSHTGQVLRGGGLAVLVGSATGVLVGAILLDSMRHDLAIALLISLAFATIGLIDDLHVLPALVRLGGQIVLSAAFVLLAPVDGVQWIAGVAAALWLVLFVNAFNFMDGINGISGVTGFLIAGGLTIAALRWGSPDVAVASAALAGASLGFLPANFPTARVFLGDVGSYLIGSTLAALAVILLIEGVPVVPVLLPFSLYVSDVLVTMARRLRKGENILKSHRTHVYQKLANGGLGHVRTTTIVAAVTATLITLGQVAGENQAGIQLAAVVAGAAIIAGYLTSPSWLRSTSVIGERKRETQSR